MTTVKNVVSYLRVSTNEQVDGFSLDAQEHEIKSYCEKNRYNLLRVYRDKGITGTSIDKRIDFQNMIHDIASNKNIDAVVVWSLSRFSRKLSQLLNIIEILDQHNTRLIVIKEGIDTSTPQGKAFVSFSGIMAEMERENIVSACRLGMRQRAREGKWNGGRVLGYRTDNDKELVIHEEEAKIIREIFHLFAIENWGYKKIASTLNLRGLKTVKGREWSINGIKTIIDNPLYVGKIRWGVHEFWNKNRRAGKTEEFVLVPGKHIPIISDELWEKTQVIRKIRGKKPEKSYEGNFLLTGLLKCPQCGATMISHKIKKYKRPGEHYRYYMCGNNANKGPASCRTNLVNADYAEGFVLKRIESLVSSPEIINSIVMKTKKSSDVDTQPLKEDIKNLNQVLQRIKNKKDENFKMNLENKLSTNILFQQMEFLEKQEIETNEKLYVLESELGKIENQSLSDPRVITNTLSNFIQIFNTAKIEHKKRLLQSIIDFITVVDGENPTERTISNIVLEFEPQEIEALSSKNSYAATYGTVHSG